MRSILSARRGITLLAAAATGVAVFAVPSAAEALTPAVIINSVAPNPFSPNGNSPNTTAIVDYTLSVDETDVQVHVSNGSTDVYVVDRFAETAGAYQWTWDGTDGLGHVQPDGLYTITVSATGGTVTGTASHSVRVDSTVPFLSSISGGGTTFYPHQDGYKDTFTPKVNLSERGTLALTIKNSAGHVVRVLQATRASGMHGLTWNGRNTAGSLVPAGKYHWNFTETDAAGNHRTSANFAVHVSDKKLVKTTKVITHSGAPFATSGHQGCGASVSKANSTFAGGVLLSATCSNRQGVALTGYNLRLPGAIRYGRMTFQMYGYSHRGFAAIVPLVYSSDINDYDVIRSSPLVVSSSTKAWRTLGGVAVSGHYTGNHVVHFAFGLGNQPQHPADFDLRTVRVKIGCVILR